MIPSNRQGKSLQYLSRITLVLAVISVISVRGTPPDKLGECTLAIFHPNATIDGKPLLWKNRDVSNPRQAVHQGGGIGEFHYVGIGYAGDGTRVYGGVNETGFAIANSNSYNIGAGNDKSDFDDGDLQTTALKTCSSLEQFRQLLDLTNAQYGGRTQPSNFFTFDSSGATSIFEAGKNTWVEYPVTATDQYAVRANYSYSGYIPTNPDWGIFRHDRTHALIDHLFETGLIHYDSIFSISRDVAPEGWQNGQFAYSPAGDTISLARSVCRYYTASAMVIQGGKNTPNGWIPPVCWFMLGKPISSIAIPVWPTQSSISQLLTDRVTTTSPMCDQTRRLFTTSMINVATVESSHLNFMLNTVRNQETSIIRKTTPWLNRVITPATAAAVSDSMANIAYHSLYIARPEDAIIPPVTPPVSYILSNPAPNPFNPVTTIRYSLITPATVKLSIFNIAGQRIGGQDLGFQYAGNHNLQWSAPRTATGLVWFKITIGNQDEWRKGLLLK